MDRLKGTLNPTLRVVNGSLRPPDTEHPHTKPPIIQELLAKLPNIQELRAKLLVIQELLAKLPNIQEQAKPMETEATVPEAQKEPGSQDDKTVITQL